MKPIKYCPGNLIGIGGSALVREVEGTGGQLVVKIGDKTSKPRILNECKIYRMLENVPAVPKVRYCDMDQLRCAIFMENAGTSLRERFRKFYPILPAKSLHVVVAFYASRMITALQAVHSRGIIHGDIHPGNFMVQDTGSDIIVRLIDFGAAVVFGEPQDSSDVEINYCFASAERTSSPFGGPSVADDLTALAYTVIFFARGGLPWESLICSNGRVIDLEGLIVLKYICGAELLGAGLPSVFCDFISFALNVKDSAPPQEAEYRTHASAFWKFFCNAKTSKMGK